MSDRAGSRTGAGGLTDSQVERLKQSDSVSTPSWWFVLRGTVREFLEDGLIDQSAALTYFTILSVFPAGITLVALVSLFGQDPANLRYLASELDGVIPAETLETGMLILDSVITSGSAGLGITAGTLIALWTASLYVRAFGRAMNRIYDVEEGRPLWKLWPQMVLLTAVLLVLLAVNIVLLVVTGPVAHTLGQLFGLGALALQTWGIVKWPLQLVLVAIMLALLYYYTPNVRLPRMRWISVGSVVAILIGALASFGFGVYVGNFARYDVTYGALAGVVIFLLWVWIMNLAILFGAELDGELERARQLRLGEPAEEEVTLIPRDTRASDKAAEVKGAWVEEGKSMRESVAAELDRGGPEPSEQTTRTDPTAPSEADAATDADTSAGGVADRGGGTGRAQ